MRCGEKNNLAENLKKTSQIGTELNMLSRLRQKWKNFLKVVRTGVTNRVWC